jgi:hypothetical protein
MEKLDTTPYQQFVQEVDGKEKIEDKIRLCLDFMRSALSQDKIPAFRDFWQAKRLCLGLFKEKIAPRSRTVFWAEYIELSEENRKLKEVLDEQSSFAKEQMELATEALEKDLDSQAELLAETEPVEVPSVLKGHAESYTSLQKELSLLTAFAGRVNALRKELIHVSLRLKQKNRLFERLKVAGDQIFPRKKELMEQLADLFSKDVLQFVEYEVEEPLFERREQIKALQSFAKSLTLSSATFMEMRGKLSECWEKVREKEKEKHQENLEKRKQFRENYDKVHAKIEALQQEGPSLEAIDTLFAEMKDIELGRDEVKALKKELHALQKPLEEKQQKERKEEARLQEEKREQQQKAQQALLDHLQEVLNQADVLPLDTLVEKWEALVKEEKTLGAEGALKVMLQSRLETLFDHIQEKKWQALLEEGQEEISTSLHSLLDERHKTRRKIKTNLELYRKTLGGSGLGLEESMQYQELASMEKLRLDAVETMIEEIEEKLFDLEE